MENIKTIILCGGTGTRLKEETEFKPKPLVDIGGKPILWHIMKIYTHHGFNHFIMALGFKGEKIKEYFLQNPAHDSGFHAMLTDTGLETPHGERVLKVKDAITEDLFMVTYGDGLSDVDIKKLVAFHKSHGKVATITGVHPISKWGVVKVENDNTISEFAQKPMMYDYVNGGFMVLNKTFFNYLKPGDMIEDGLKRLIPEKQLALYRHEGFWYGMDTYSEFLQLNKLWQEDPKWKIWQN